MSVLYLVIPIALLMSAGAVLTFLWAVRRGQFDDLSTPGLRMLHDDEPAPKATQGHTGPATGAAQQAASQEPAEPVS